MAESIPAAPPVPGPEAPAASASTRPSVWRRTAPPLAAFLVAQIAIVLAARTLSIDPLRPTNYLRWDSFRYISIATRGYFLEEDAEGKLEDSNAPWFPGYALAIKKLHRSHLQPPRAGKIVSEAFALAFLVLLWNAGLAVAPGSRPLMLLFAAALFPGFVYHHAVFPISMVSFFVLLALVLAVRGAYAAAGLSGALGAFTYSTGFFAMAPLAVAVLLDRRLTRLGKALALLKAPAVCALGFVAALAYQSEAVGWGAFFRVQREFYGNGIFNPVGTFLHNTRYLWRGELAPEAVPHLQTLLVAALVIAALLVSGRQRRALGTLEVVLAVHMLVYWLAPQVIGRHVSIYRAESLLVPMVPLLGRWPTSAVAAVLVVLAGLGLAMSYLFFATVLV
jgi:hypothetical protein